MSFDLRNDCYCESWATCYKRYMHFRGYLSHCQGSRANKKSIVVVKGTQCSSILCCFSFLYYWFMNFPIPKFYICFYSRHTLYKMTRHWDAFNTPCTITCQTNEGVQKKGSHKLVSSLMRKLSVARGFQILRYVKLKRVF